MSKEEEKRKLIILGQRTVARYILDSSIENIYDLELLLSKLKNVAEGKDII